MTASQKEQRQVALDLFGIKAAGASDMIDYFLPLLESVQLVHVKLHTDDKVHHLLPSPHLQDDGKVHPWAQ